MNFILLTDKIRTHYFHICKASSDSRLGTINVHGHLDKSVFIVNAPCVPNSKNKTGQKDCYSKGTGYKKYIFLKPLQKRRLLTKIR